MIVNVIQILTKVGFRVISLICDNYRMNRTNTSIKEKLPCFIQNFSDPQQQIYLLFDTVHLLKALRNNWLNQKNKERSLVFCHFDNSQLILFANLSDLEKIHSAESNNIIKSAPALSKKVLNPSSLERQNVQLAVRLFDEKNIEALNQSYNEMKNVGTAEFLKTILHWWRIVNVRSPKSGYHQRDSFRDPIREPNDKNIQFLLKFLGFSLRVGIFTP
jgi:hypothetical protein